MRKCDIFDDDLLFVPRCSDVSWDVTLNDDTDDDPAKDGTIKE